MDLPKMPQNNNWGWESLNATALKVSHHDNIRDASHIGQNFMQCLKISLKQILSFSFVQGKISWYKKRNC